MDILVKELSIVGDTYEVAEMLADIFKSLPTEDDRHDSDGVVSAWTEQEHAEEWCMHYEECSGSAYVPIWDIDRNDNISYITPTSCRKVTCIPYGDGTSVFTIDFSNEYNRGSEECAQEFLGKIMSRLNKQLHYNRGEIKEEGSHVQVQ